MATWGFSRWQRGLTAAVAAFLFWAQSSIDPVVGPDPSWQAGLSLARSQNLAWGPDVLFTFGPAGFLQNSAYYTFDQTLYATLYQPIVIATLFLGVATALRGRRHTPIRSLIRAFITTGVIVVLHSGHGFALPGLAYPELAVLAAFAWAAAPLLRLDVERRTIATTCVFLGAAAGLELLVKLNTGIFIAITALALSVIADWRATGRHCATFTAFAASTLICWVLAGQPLTNLPTWLRLSVEVVSGYAEGMALPVNTYTVAAVVVSVVWIGLLGAMFFSHSPEIPRRFVMLVLLATIISARVALGRCGAVNLYFLIAFIVLAVAIAPLYAVRPILRRTLAAFIVTIVIASLSAESAFSRIIRVNRLDPISAAMHAPGQAVNRLATLALPGRLEQRVEQTKERQRRFYDIPEHFIDAIGSSPVHVDPNEASAVWAYDFTWLPVPVFQAYVAYTPTLDELNSHSLTAKPRLVLSRLSHAVPATSIDGRLALQQSPRYSRALLCDYAVHGTENRWTLFTPTAHHCGPFSSISQVMVRDNDVIAVPAPSGPDMAVLVAIDLLPPFIDRLMQGNILPLTIPTVVLDGVTYRLVNANASEPFLINSPDSVAGTNLEIHAHTIGFGRVPSALDHRDLVARLRFYEMRVAY